MTFTANLSKNRIYIRKIQNMILIPFYLILSEQNVILRYFLKISTGCIIPMYIPETLMLIIQSVQSITE